MPDRPFQAAEKLDARKTATHEEKHSFLRNGAPLSVAAAYSIFTSGVYRATAPDVAFPQEKPHFAEPDCAE
jgi:hypothetical protein